MTFDDIIWRLFSVLWFAMELIYFVKLRANLIPMRRTVEALESLFSRICQGSYPYEWTEDHISYQLMKALRNLFENRTVHFDNWSKLVEWRSFKNRGKQETSYGDIALLVNIQFSSGEILKGVVNIEAKRSFPSGTFESINQYQLDRIYDNLPHSHLLFFNHQEQKLPSKFPDSSTWQSCMWITPVNSVRQLNQQVRLKDNWKLLRISFPFSMFLTARVFWGLDLDFREEVYKDIETGINRIIDPSYLGVVNVYYENQRPLEIALSEIWQEIDR